MTLVDVANTAGVSPSMVSHVITGRQLISPRKRRWVLENIRVLGYQHPGAASSPVRSRVGVFALEMPLQRERNAGTAAEFIAGATETAHAHHFDILPLAPDGGGAGRRWAFYAVLAAGRFSWTSSQATPIYRPLASYLPAALVDGEPADHPGLSHVGFD